MSDRRVEIAAALDDLARHLPAPDPDVDVVSGAIEAITVGGGADGHEHGPAGRRRWPAAVAAAVVILLATTLAVPVSREAVADLLGIGGVRVRLTGEIPDDLGTRLVLGRPVTLDEAAEAAEAELLAPPGAGDPAGAFAGRPPAAVTLVWAPTEELPEVLDTGVGLLLTSFPGRIDLPVVEKLLPPGSTYQATAIGPDGVPAWFVSGAPHQLVFLDERGRPMHDSARLSANTLVWEREGVTYRLESSLPLADAVALAESLEPLEP